MSPLIRPLRGHLPPGEGMRCAQFKLLDKLEFESRCDFGRTFEDRGLKTGDGSASLLLRTENRPPSSRTVPRLQDREPSPVFQLTGGSLKENQDPISEILEQNIFVFYLST